MLQNSEFLLNYFPVMVFFGIAVLLSVLIMVLPKILARSKPQVDKLKAYECGFDAFGDARSTFDVRFYLVAILFIIFDLEVSFLIPWALVLRNIGIYGFLSMMFFLAILTIGFIYEWKKGALNWE